ncbi:hypothetical protein F5I97DRAFT_681232 [Phlebopus sp. FC_14]|nr:hypothetical protein F5I97DRAFT_681232 [Phlebopus sp. FC_14]
MFRSHISTELARDVLEGLLDADMVTVHKVVDGRKRDVRKGTRDAAAAIKNAYERALVHGCKRDGLEQVKSPSKSRDCDDVAWNWSWKNFPKAPLKERALVDYLNTIIDTALSLPCMKNRKPLYRFAVPHDTHHAYPLSHEPDKADSRPDFVVLPIDAFEKHEKTGSLTIYEPKREWQNFTIVRLTGKCKDSDDTGGVHQVQRYMRDTRRAQPWLRFVTAMTVTREVVNFVRGDGSGMERVRMRLQFGRSCLEFVRMLMAVALCEAEIFGKNSHIGLATQALTTPVVVGTSQPETSTSGAAAMEQGQSNDAALTTSAEGSSYQSRSSARSSAQSSTAHLIPPPDTHTSHSSQSSGAITASSGRVTRSSEKRRRNNEDDANLMPPPPAKKEVHEEVRLIVQVPTTLFGIFEHDGLLFTGASIRGRGTVVFVTHRQNTPSIKVALKLAWQDVARKPERDEVLEILSKNPRHENVLVPKRYALWLTADRMLDS